MERYNSLDWNDVLFDAIVCDRLAIIIISINIIVTIIATGLVPAKSNVQAATIIVSYISEHR